MQILQKQKDKDFLVLNFSDIHLRNKYWNENYPQKLIGLHIMKTLIEEVKPDLITVTGDLASYAQWDAYNGLADFFDSFNIPWSVVWGNHDNEAGQEPVAEVEKLFHARKNFVYEAGDPALGQGNFIIGIEEEGRPVEALRMMDSHARVPFTLEDGTVKNAYAKLFPQQIEWYKEQISELKAKGYKESSLLLHIPIFAYTEAFYSAILKGLDPQEIRFEESGNPVFWNKGYEGCHGLMHGKIRTHLADEGMFDAILEGGHTKTILCGHDHKNNFVVKHKGVQFAYTTKTGSGKYSTKNLVGGTVIRISSEGVEEIIQKPVKIAHLEAIFGHPEKALKENG